MRRLSITVRMALLVGAVRRSTGYLEDLNVNLCFRMLTVLP